MPEQWLTYRQLAELWNTTPEAARARCRRGNYERRTNEQGMSEVLIEFDGIIAGSYPEAQNWMGNVPTEHDQGASDQKNRQTLQVMEEQVATLRWECQRAEQQVELLRRYLDTEREQSAHLMKLLEKRQHGRSVGRRILARLLFWRTPATTTLSTAGPAFGPSPDVMRSTPITGPVSWPDTPDRPGPAPDIRPDRSPDTPDSASEGPNTPRETSPDSGTSPLS